MRNWIQKETLIENPPEFEKQKLFDFGSTFQEIYIKPSD